MPSRLIPLFPLPVVIFPRTPFPLHIFEDRYKQMVGNALRDNSEFGVLPVDEGATVNAGCTVVVEKVLNMYADGRMDILTRGRRRFEVIALNNEKDYLQAEVRFFDDEDLTPVPAELRSEALAQYKSLAGLDSARDTGDPDLTDPQLSFQLAQALPDVEFLGGLLRQRSETARLKEFNRYVADYVPRQRVIERMKGLAPTNGHGGKPAGI